jgi:hypothetical protein
VRVELGPTFLAQRLGLAPKRWMSMLADPAEQLRALVAYRPQVVCATVSSLHELALAACR